MTRAGAALACCVLALPGCAESAPGGPASAVIDSAGVRIVTHTVPLGSVAPLAVVGGHDLEIGLRDGPPEYTFADVTDGRLFPDGSVVIADGGAQELRVFDPAGNVVSVFGGEGEGSGEFAVLTNIADERPFGAQAFARPSGGAVVFAHGWTYELTWLSEREAPSAIVRALGRRRPVTAEMVETLRAERLAESDAPSEPNGGAGSWTKSRFPTPCRRSVLWSSALRATYGYRATIRFRPTPPRGSFTLLTGSCAAASRCRRGSASSTSPPITCSAWYSTTSRSPSYGATRS